MKQVSKPLKTIMGVPNNALKEPSRESRRIPFTESPGQQPEEDLRNIRREGPAGRTGKKRVLSFGREQGVIELKAILDKENFIMGDELRFNFTL